MFLERLLWFVMSEQCKFPSPDSCQKRSLWTHEEADLAPHQVVGLVLQVRDAEMVPQALGYKSLGPFFFIVNQQGPCSTAIEEDGGDKGLVEPGLACEADGVALPDPV